jgi:hypothetical protein
MGSPSAVPGQGGRAPGARFRHGSSQGMLRRAERQESRAERKLVQRQRMAAPPACAVQLQARDAVRRQPAQRAPDHVLLRRPVGRRQAAAAPVLVDGGARQHRQRGADAGATQHLAPRQHHGADRLGAHVAVGGGVQCLAAPVGRQHAGPVAGQRPGGGEREVDAQGGGGAAGGSEEAGKARRQPSGPLSLSGQQQSGTGGEGGAGRPRPPGVAAAQRARRQVGADQRGAAGGVHRQRGAAQPKGVCQAARGDGQVRAGGVEGVDRHALLQRDARVLQLRHAHEHAGAAVAGTCARRGAQAGWVGGAGAE